MPDRSAIDEADESFCWPALRPIALNHGNSPLAFVPLVLVGVFLEAGFTPAALAYLADVSQDFARDRGLLMGLYSVILGIGQLIGAVVGGLFAQFAYFDGLAYLTVLLAFTALGPLIVTVIVQRPTGCGNRTVSEDVPQRPA
ncbi:MAG: MFS transporter [Chloroflexota bacterium]|nr:MFS transporter [Chloroflexota bacterium]